MAENAQMWYIYIMNNRGQNVVEYILLVTAVVLVFAALMAPGGRFHQAVNKDIRSIVPAIDQGTNSIKF